MTLETRLSRLEQATPKRDDTEAHAERLRASLALKIAGIASRRVGIPSAPMTIEQGDTLRAQLDARLAALELRPPAPLPTETP